jgi:2-oxo-3-hexenedioate decarboxylase/2-keto-4-pentenoate hydratase
MGRDLPPSGAPFTREAVAAAVDAVAPAVEIVDDRQCDYKTLEVLSLVADNSWNEGLVHGAFVTQWPALETAEGVVELDGVAVDRGLGGDVLGHPFEPLTWLANHLAQTGGGLCAGDIVMTGSLVTTRFPPVPGRFRFAVSGLGAVEVAVA